MSNEIIISNGTASLIPTGTGGGTIEVGTAVSFLGSVGTYALAAGTTPLSFTCSAGTGKYYWRYKYTGESVWSEVNEFWYQSTAAGTVAAGTTWGVYAVGSETTQYYAFQVNPLGYDIRRGEIYRVQERNLAGGLLSEFVTSKDEVTLDYSQQVWMGSNFKAEVARFHALHTAVYLGVRLPSAANGTDQVYRAWKVEFAPDLQLDRPGVVLRFMEV